MVYITTPAIPSCLVAFFSDQIEIFNFYSSSSNKQAWYKTKSDPKHKFLIFFYLTEFSTS